MLSMHQITEKVLRETKKLHQFSTKSTEINVYMTKYIDNLCYTKSRKNRYSKKDIEGLHRLTTCYKWILQEEYCIFGYWYEGEFYTTAKDTQYKTTTLLHSMGLTQQTWDKLPNGFYYKQNLKEYYV